MISFKLILMIITGLYLMVAIEQTTIHTGNFYQDYYNATHPGMGYSYSFNMKH